MAIDLATYGVRVNSLCPTFVRTPMTAPFFANPDFHARTVSRFPLGRVGEVEDLIGAIVFPASDASALMTGTSLTVDGGWTAILWGPQAIRSIVATAWALTSDRTCSRPT